GFSTMSGGAVPMNNTGMGKPADPLASSPSMPGTGAASSLPPGSPTVQSTLRPAENRSFDTAPTPTPSMTSDRFGTPPTARSGMSNTLPSLPPPPTSTSTSTLVPAGGMSPSTLSP